MNIGVDLRCLMTKNKTGVGEYTTELLSSVFDLDKTNQYFLFYNSAKDVTTLMPKWTGQNIHYVHTRWPNKLLNFCLLILKRPRLDKMAIENCKLKIVNLDAWFSPNLNFSVLSPKTNSILTVHDLSFEFFPEFFTPRQRLWHKIIGPKKQCEHANIILTPSENTKRDIVNYYKIDSNKIKVIYPGLSSIFYHLSPIFPELEEKKKQTKIKYNLPDNFILFLGTIEPRKNILGLIEAFEKSYSSLPLPYSLVIAGAPGWNNKKIYERAATSPLKERIKFIGYVESEDKPALYASASLFVYPSFYEGFGFPALEALASGVPVITTNRSSLPEITGPSAYLVNARYPGQLSEAITKLLTDQNLRERQIKNGLVQAEKFKWKKAAGEFLEVIK